MACDGNRIGLCWKEGNGNKRAMEEEEERKADEDVVGQCDSRSWGEGNPGGGRA